METKISQKISLVVNANYTGFENTLNPADIFSVYQNLSGKTYLKRVELLDLMFYTVNTNTQEYYCFRGMNQNMGYDVSGVYQPILRRVRVTIPRANWDNYRTFDTREGSFDILTRCIDFGKQFNLTGLMSQNIHLYVELFEQHIFTNMDWHTDATGGGGVEHAFALLQYTLQTIEN